MTHTHTHVLLRCTTHIFLSRLQERFSCTHAALHATGVLILSRDSCIADYTVRHPGVERLFSSYILCLKCYQNAYFFFDIGNRIVIELSYKSIWHQGTFKKKCLKLFRTNLWRELIEWEHLTSFFFYFISELHWQISNKILTLTHHFTKKNTNIFWIAIYLWTILINCILMLSNVICNVYKYIY